MSADIIVIGSSTVDAIARPIDAYPPVGGTRPIEELVLTNGGCALNCCVALRKLGLACALISRLGDDWFGDFLLQQIRGHGIEHDAVIRQPGTRTAFTLAAVRSDGERSFLHYAGTDLDLGRQDVPMNRIRRARFCFYAGAMVLPRFDGEPAASVLAEAQQAGVITLLDSVFVDDAVSATPRLLHPFRAGGIGADRLSRAGRHGPGDPRGRVQDGSDQAGPARGVLRPARWPAGSRTGVPRRAHGGHDWRRRQLGGGLHRRAAPGDDPARGC
jgi:hypothetical protein